MSGTTPTLSQALLVGLGGFVGSAGRFVIGSWVQRLTAASAFPLGILAVNVLGCLAIGFLGGLNEARGVLTTSVRLFWLVGVLGGFTTFSTFAYDTLGLAREAELGSALANVAANVLLSLAAAWLGYWLAPSA